MWPVPIAAACWHRTSLLSMNGIRVHLFLNVRLDFFSTKLTWVRRFLEGPEHAGHAMKNVRETIDNQDAEEFRAKTWEWCSEFIASWFRDAPLCFGFYAQFAQEETPHLRPVSKREFHICKSVVGVPATSRTFLAFSKRFEECKFFKITLAVSLPITRMQLGSRRLVCQPSLHRL